MSKHIYREESHGYDFRTLEYIQRAAATGQGTDELADYNAYLASLERRRGPSPD